jgi:hypothetical protein
VVYVSGLTRGTLVAANETLVVTGNVTGGEIDLYNATLIIEGTHNSSAAIINMEPGTIDTLDMTSIAQSRANNPTVEGFQPGDSIGSSTQAIAGASLGSNAISVAVGKTIDQIALTGANAPAGTNFYSQITQETVAGVTFNVATLDPPVGATGSSGDPGFVKGATGATGGSNPATSGPTGAGLDGHASGGSLATDLTNFGKLVETVSKGAGASSGFGGGPDPTQQGSLGFGHVSEEAQKLNSALGDSHGHGSGSAGSGG